MSPGTASDDPGPGASQGQEEMGLETKTNFPEILLGEGMGGWAEMESWAMRRGGEKLWVGWTGTVRLSCSLKALGCFGLLCTYKSISHLARIN